MLTLTGDTFRVTENAASGFPDGARATVLTGSHHGATSNRSNDPDWATTSLEVTIFSAGASFRHPRCKAMLNYKNSLGSSNPHRLRCGKREGCG